MPFAFGFGVEEVEAFGFVGLLDFGELGGEDAGDNEAAVGSEAVEDAVGLVDEEVGN